MKSVAMKLALLAEKNPTVETVSEAAGAAGMALRDAWEAAEILADMNLPGADHLAAMLEADGIESVCSALADVGEGLR